MTQGDWQPVSTAPLDDVWVLAHLDSPLLGTCIHTMRMGRAPVVGGVFLWDIKAKVTHWMPLPQPPEMKP